MRHLIYILHFTSYILFTCLLFCGAPAVTAAGRVQLRLRAGYSVGGTAPLGVPVTIRAIDAYRLAPSLVAGLDAGLPLSPRWGVAAGLRIENKAMDTDVTTKGYRMELVKGDSRMEGLFTGRVHQEVTQWMLTLPVQAAYSVSSPVQLRVGPYVSLLLCGDFSGTASGGYLRQGNPTGAKIIIGEGDGERATYDFSRELRPLQAGVAAGLDWQLRPRLGLSADLSWGLTGIFPASFRTVEQTLYPIYGTLSVFYNL